MNKSEGFPDDRGVRKYASDLLSDSLVTGVPSIVKASSLPAKVFKTCILCFCLAGFLYQTWEFLSHVLTYPSTVDIEVETPEEILSPALTICDNNGIQRSKYCKKFPENCQTPENKSAFCAIYPTLCHEEIDWEIFKMPKKQFHDFENYATTQDFIELGPEEKSFLEVQPFNTTDIQGPFLLFKYKKLGTLCYTINSRVRNDSDPNKILVRHDVIGRLRDPRIAMKLTFDMHEVFVPGRDAGAWFALHSPFETSNPYYQGHFLYPGKRYSVIFRKEIENLLQYPYKRNCRDYIDGWLKNGKKGPRSQMICKEVCDMEFALEACYNCTDKFIDYPRDEDACIVDWSYCIGDFPDDKLRECSSDCREDCVKYKFPYRVEERPLDDKNVFSEYAFVADKNSATVELYLEKTEVLVLNHRPRYKVVEVFGYIGGYVGIWLGISLIAVVDFFENLIRIVLFAFKQHLPKNSRNSRR